MTRRSETRKYDTIPSWWKLVARTLGILKDEKKNFIILLAIFTPLAWLVAGVLTQNFSNIKSALNLFDAESLSLTERAAIVITGFFTGQITSVPQDALVLLNILSLIMWLSFIWIARYGFAKKATTVREALYTSPAAFVPFVLLTLLLVVELIPALVASVILFSLQGGGFTNTTIETALFLVLASLLIVLSLYFVIPILIAMQVVALPGIYPWRALRNARRLVMNRRFAILRKLIALPILILLVWLLVFIPALLLDNQICSESSCWSTYILVPPLYYSLIGFSLAFSSTYLYVVYRALLEQEDDYV